MRNFNQRFPVIMTRLVPSSWFTWSICLSFLTEPPPPPSFWLKPNPFHLLLLVSGLLKHHWYKTKFPHILICLGRCLHTHRHTHRPSVWTSRWTSLALPVLPHPKSSLYSCVAFFTVFALVFLQECVGGRKTLKVCMVCVCVSFILSQFHSQLHAM